jgi:tol-pal system protein YbgF
MKRTSVFVCLGFVGAVGCVGRNTEEMQLDEMREALTHVDENNSFGEKLTAKELAEIVKQQPPPPGGPLSRQQVVHFDDGSEEEANAPAETSGFEAADDPGARPVIRVHGIPHAHGGDVVEETMPDETQATPRTPQPSALDPEAKKAYDAALALVNNKQYALGLDALAGFMLRYPDHPYVANAMYWRGECYFAEGEYLRATEQFEGVIARFPLGGKTPDALLKLGICQQKLQNPQKAQTYFDKLTREWPRSDAARRIPSTTPTATQQKDHP